MATKTKNLLANLPDNLTIRKVNEHFDYTELFLEYPEERICPNCGSVHCVIKDSGRICQVYHTPLNRHTTHLVFHRRRFLCRDCRRSFMEQPFWLHPSLHITQALYLSICLDLTEMLSVSAIAAKNCVTPEIVSAVMELIEFRQPERLPEILCVDEFKGESGIWNPSKRRWDTNKYHVSLVDGSSHTVLDVLPEIRADQVIKYFRNYPADCRRRVRFFCCDMHGGFISAAKKIFPDAVICIDLFHVIKHLNEDMVDGIRRRIQNSPDLSPEDYALLKGSMRLLKVKESSFSKKYLTSGAKAREKLKKILSSFSELDEAYEALQEFHHICEQSSYSLKRTLLTDWLAHHSSSNVPEIISASHMIRHWRGYIQNTWKYGLSNGICEGFNNRIKVLKRTSYGLHSFDSLRKRILLTCGYTHLSHSPGTLFTKQTTKKGGSLL